MKKGALTSAMFGPLRPRITAISAAQILGNTFKTAIDEVERNHATQVGLSCCAQISCQKCFVCKPKEGGLSDY